MAELTSQLLSEVGGFNFISRGVVNLPKVLNPRISNPFLGWSGSHYCMSKLHMNACVSSFVPLNLYEAVLSHQ